MEAIICQTCDEVISYVDCDKSGTLYGQCPNCASAKTKEQQN
ncbi:GapA-binding peptide SR1P [Desmospora activa]|uniref:SR1 protein n=1 Tax=Desmospora activa DSM 45169 TaxID=1121389 RepID=A0A2T4ZBP6_9BACL|nr:GapA-binding peptide SR1P [Desmospora activa]PTM59295.1 SR1 protein [Desmospora activa DSM 45169]